jgi:hypothetical protein
MSQDDINRGGESLLKAIDNLHEEDRVFYWRLVYQDKQWNTELVREINRLMVDADGKNRDSRYRRLT